MIQDNYYGTPIETCTRITMSYVPQILSFFWLQFLVNFMENCPRQMLDFTANMHGIQFRLGFRPRWELTALPQTSQLDLEEGRGGEGRKGVKKREGERREKKGGKRKGKEGSFFTASSFYWSCVRPWLFLYMLSRIYLSLPQWEQEGKQLGIQWFCIFIHSLCHCSNTSFITVSDRTSSGAHTIGRFTVIPCCTIGYRGSHYILDLFIWMLYVSSLNSCIVFHVLVTTACKQRKYDMLARALLSSKTGHSFLPQWHVKAVRTTLIEHGFANRFSCWHFTSSSSLF